MLQLGSREEAAVLRETLVQADKRTAAGDEAIHETRVGSSTSTNMLVFGLGI